jgi:hypothetical protein
MKIYFYLTQLKFIINYIELALQKDIMDMRYYNQDPRGTLDSKFDSLNFSSDKDLADEF